MRVNVYAEEMTDQVEIIAKEIDGRVYTGVRFYLHLPVTIHEGHYDGMNVTKDQQRRGPFMHRPGDDDSSAVTFWGKQDLRKTLEKALQMLDTYYDMAARGQTPSEAAASANSPVVSKS